MLIAPLKRRCAPVAVVLISIVLARHSAGQTPTARTKAAKEPASATTPPPEEVPPVPAPEKVVVNPTANDNDIAQRLIRILEATEWFSRPRVRVDEGVVFLSGQTAMEDHKAWAGDLARKTEDVVAVVNRIAVTERSFWDFTPAWTEVLRMIRLTIQSLPLIVLALIMLILTWLAAKVAILGSRRVFERRMQNKLLQQVAARAVAVPVIIVGCYLILRISGLTQMAATVLGGTGLIGLVIGIAFRDIAENFLASILVSMQRPFAIGDLIDVEGRQGFVQTVSTRGTLLMTLDGNHVHIPNSTIYKSVISNLTANPKRRMDFMIGIGYSDSATRAQELILQVLLQHEAVLAEPEPLVLVEKLGTSTVDLRIYFWTDMSKYSGLKVRSSLIRLCKKAIEDAGMAFPDESREVVFPKAVPIRILDGNDGSSLPREFQVGHSAPPAPPRRPRESGAVASAAEGNLNSEQDVIKQQARESRLPEAGQNLVDETTETQTTPPEQPAAAEAVRPAAG